MVIFEICHCITIPGPSEYFSYNRDMNINELVMALKSDGIHLNSGQTVSVINNDRTLWLPATVVHVANYSSYIVRVIGQAEYRRI